MARSRARMELGDRISSRRRTGRSSQFGKTAAQIAKEENDYYSALEYLPEEIREIAKADMDKKKSMTSKTETKKAGLSTLIKNSASNKTITNSAAKDTEYALEYLPEEIREVAEADIVTRKAQVAASSTEAQRASGGNSTTVSSNSGTAPRGFSSAQDETDYWNNLFNLRNDNLKTENDSDKWYDDFSDHDREAAMQVKGLDDEGYELLDQYFGDEESADKNLLSLTERQVGTVAGIQNELNNWELGFDLNTDTTVWADGYLDTNLTPEYQQREEMVDRAQAYANYVWMNTNDFVGYNTGNDIFYFADETYRGVPYSQNRHKDPTEFDELIDTRGFNEMYTRTNKDGSIDTMPWYGQDCSGLVCDAWGIERASTLFLKDAMNEKIIPTLDDFSELKPGDAVIKRENGSGHIRFVSHVKDDKVYTIEQTVKTLSDGTKVNGTYLGVYTFDELESGKYEAISAIGMDVDAYNEKINGN